MQIFQKDDIKVFACRLPLPGGAAGRDMRAVEERRGVVCLLREAFGGDVGQLGHTDDGAPFLPGRSESVSVSHCRGWAVLAVSAAGRRIGVDAETVGRERQLRGVATRFLSLRQAEVWGATDGLLLRAWTIKEALYKAAGIPGWALTDIPLPSREWGVASAAERPVEEELAAGGSVFTICDVDCGDVSVTVTLAAEC